MTDAEKPPPARRRPRERGQGQRGKRVNLRLSNAEHATLETAATRHGTTLAGYVSAAALSAARDELPPDAREMMVRLFAMQRDAVLDGKTSAASVPIPEFLRQGWAGAEPVTPRTLHRAFTRALSPWHCYLMDLFVHAHPRAHACT